MNAGGRISKPAPSDSSNRYLIAAAAGLAVAMLLALTAASPHTALYDEPFYMVGAHMLRDGSSVRDLLLARNDNLAGPLFPILHWLLSPVTGLDPWVVRWVNPVLLAAAAWSLCYTLRTWGYASPWWRVAMLLACPTFWVCTGMALTEIPAFALVCACVAAVTWAMTAPAEAKARAWLGFVVAGISFGLAVLGRQPYLPAAIGFAMIAAFAPRFRWPAIVGLLCAVAVPLPVFLTWGGLVAPQARQFAYLSIEHGMLAYVYLSALVLLIAPRYFVPARLWAAGTAIVAALVAVMAGGLSLPIAGGIARHLSPGQAHLFQLGMSGILAGGGAAMIVAALFNLWQRRDDRIFVLVTLLGFGLTGTSIAIGHQFSSRYLMTAFPFVLLAVQPYFVVSRFAALRLVAGSVIGAFSLHAYQVFSIH